MSTTFNKSDFIFFKSLLKKAGESALNYQKGDIEAMRKSDRSIVTQADLTVQGLLIEGISARYKDMRFIHEENYAGGMVPMEDDTLLAIIDPIDGTAMYSMHLPEWCVSVGIFKGYDPLYGFVYAPGFNMFFHNDDSNAYLNDRIVRADTQIRLDSESNLFYASEVHRRFDINFPGKIRNLGSTALHACLTVDNARNRTFAFIGKSKLWDWAGAIPVIAKAGVNLRYISGEEIIYAEVMRNDYCFPDYLVAYNSDDFESVRKIFKKTDS